MRTTDSIIASIPRQKVDQLPTPAYKEGSSLEKGVRLGLAVASMKNHTTDEGWQLFQALEYAGYSLCGLDLTCESVYAVRSLHVEEHKETDIAKLLQWFDPSVVVLQDKREWEGLTAGGQKTFNHRERFLNVGALKERDDVFKVTVLKDAQSAPFYHRESADEIGCHAWIIYYHPKVVSYLATYTRPQHLIRTYHTVDFDLIPKYTSEGRQGCVLSGALSKAYPLRQKLVLAQQGAFLKDTHYLSHPGYRRDGCHTPRFLETLRGFRVAICTSSIYGYALRKIIEATACGCRVITDLPIDEVLPSIDDNLVRVDSGVSLREMNSLIQHTINKYDPMAQEWFADKARWYDYRAMGVRLAEDIERMRGAYPCLI